METSVQKDSLFPAKGIAFYKGEGEMNRNPICWYTRGMDIVLKTPRMKKPRLILNRNISIDRSTGHGEDADFYEKKPFGGRKWIDMRYATAITEDKQI